ncbi:hypothetical protein OH738_18145 [Streptomyces hirsutus]|uniref:DnaB-like helicase N-terminal domain-containing protein n=1 Tax=Streptomyces hirsutus TaxID=35620 RepID=UPI003867F0D2|nr:hypothetical protein OH738_18145 [Streptomyces hirsutus]
MNDRRPPQNLNAERTVLGCMVANPLATMLISQYITARDFYRPAHTLIFEALTAVADRGQEVSYDGVEAELDDRGHLESVGGDKYLLDLVAASERPATAVRYAQIVHEAAMLRRLADAGARITALAYGSASLEIHDLLTQPGVILDAFLILGHPAKCSCPKEVWLPNSDARMQAAAEASLPPWCGHCGDPEADPNPARFNPRLRLRDDKPCPDCHPQP